MQSSTLRGVLIALMLAVNTVCLFAQDAALVKAESKGVSVQAQGCTWTIFTDKEMYAPSDPIVLTFTRRNDTSGALNFGFPTEVVWLFSVQVVRPDNRPVPHTLYYGQRENSYIGGLGIAAPTGYVQTNTVQLNRYFDMTLAGEYRITLRKHLSPDSLWTNEDVRVSPPLTIRIDDSNLKK